MKTPKGLVPRAVVLAAAIVLAATGTDAGIPDQGVPEPELRTEKTSWDLNSDGSADFIFVLLHEKSYYREFFNGEIRFVEVPVECWLEAAPSSATNALLEYTSFINPTNRVVFRSHSAGVRFAVGNEVHFGWISVWVFGTPTGGYQGEGKIVGMGYNPVPREGIMFEEETPALAARVRVEDGVVMLSWYGSGPNQTGKKRILALNPAAGLPWAIIRSEWSDRNWPLSNAQSGWLFRIEQEDSQ